MPRTRFYRMPAERRDRLLHQAAREFGEHGYDGASLNHILESAGVSKGSAYYYFDDKADLFAAVVAHYWEHAIADSDLDLAALTAGNFWDRLEGLALSTFRRSLDTPWMSGVARAVWSLPPHAREIGPLAAVFERTRAYLEGVLARGRALGVVDASLPLDLLMTVLMGVDEAADRWMAAHLADMTPEDAERIHRAVFAAFRRLAEPPTGGAS